MKQVVNTYFDNRFCGAIPWTEMYKLRSQARERAIEKQKGKQADHMIYCHYDFGIEDNSKIETAWLYTGYPMSEAEFEKVYTMRNVYIGAIHK